VRWIVILAIAVLAINASFAQGTSYKGDWCSFEAPDGCYVISEDDTSVTLQKVVSSNLLMQLVVVRTEDISSSDYMLKLALKIFTDSFVEVLQDAGYIGDCTGDATDMIDGLQGRTAYNARIYDYPYVDIFGYAWGKNNDVVVMSLCWSGSQVPSMDTDYLIEPITDPYTSFRYYD